MAGEAGPPAVTAPASSSSSPSAATATAAAGGELESLYAALHARLVETGEWERTLDALQRGLDESGWEASLRKSADEKAKMQQRLSLPDLIRELSDEAYASVPDSVRDSITELLLDFISRNVEDA